jgi:hypothetical protein
MTNEHQARWISKERLAALRKSGGLRQGMLLDSYNGLILIEPVGSDLADGRVLSREEADFELQPVWCPGPKAQLREARKLIGLEAVTADLVGAV